MKKDPHYAYQSGNEKVQFSHRSCRNVYCVGNFVDRRMSDDVISTLEHVSRKIMFELSGAKIVRDYCLFPYIR